MGFSIRESEHYGLSLAAFEVRMTLCDSRPDVLPRTFTNPFLLSRLSTYSR
jgi:hypothetical protein